MNKAWQVKYSIDLNKPLGLKELLDQGIDPNIKYEFYETALIYATIKGRIDIIRLLLEYKADPNLTDSEGDTALIIASASGDADTVELLLEYKADPNIANDSQYSPLMSASIYNLLYIVRLLLDNGADPIMKNIYGDTALDMALNYFAIGDVDYEVINLLKSRMVTIR